MVSEEKQLLASLSPKKQLAFALLVFERMLPSLIAFSKGTGFDSSMYLRARDAAWSALEHERDFRVDQSLNEACLNNAPDTEMFSHELTSYALNAALAISDTLEFIEDRRADHISYVSTLATDSVDLYLSSLSPSGVSLPKEDGEIREHPLMQAEVHRQEDDIRFLSELPDWFDSNTVAAVRKRASNQAPLLPSTSR